MSSFPKPVQKLFDAFSEAGEELYLVGGAVRDYLLGTPLEELDDLDFCTSSRAEKSLEILKSHNFNYYELGFEFGTVGAVLYRDGESGYPKDCQITTYRSDEYYRRGSRHPDVQFGETIEQDLSRRDFSINSMALDGDGNLLDPYDGKRDLEKGVLRVIGEPLETLAEDPLRILRTGRFMSKLGFDPTETLEEAAYQQADYILEISRERWYQEMTKLLKGNNVRKSLNFLHQTRLLGIILPEVDILNRDNQLWERTLKVVDQISGDAPISWAALTSNVGKYWTVRKTPDDRIDHRRHGKQSVMIFEGISRRFKFDNDSRRCVKTLLRHQDNLPDKFDKSPTDPYVRRLVSQTEPYTKEVLKLERAKSILYDSEKRDKALAFFENVESRMSELDAQNQLRPHLPTGLGNRLMETFDLEPSPVIGRLKATLEEAIIEGELESNREASYYIEYLDENRPEPIQEMN